MPFMGLLLLRMIGDEHIAANWQDYNAAVGQFLGNANPRHLTCSPFVSKLTISNTGAARMGDIGNSGAGGSG